MSNTQKNLLEAIRVLLADSYILQLKTQNYHWNVKGPHFFSFHNMFEEQYRELFDANDEIAERIRALGHDAPGSFEAFSKIANLSEETGNKSALDMIAQLAKDHNRLAVDAQDLIEAAEAANDEVSIDLGVRRRDVHQKTHWMLQSHLEK